jgi:hypothetical protein
MTQTSSSNTFTMAKRQYLHSKLDEILRVWDRGTGVGSFIFIVKNGIPDFEFCTKLNFTNVSPPVNSHPHQSNYRHGQRRHRGPGRRERDRLRAAKHQAALAAQTAAAAVPASKFPGKGQVIGNGTKPTLPIPLQKGDVFPPHHSLPTTMVCTTLSNTLSSTVATSVVTPSSLSTSLPITPAPVPVVVSTIAGHVFDDNVEANNGASNDDNDDDTCARCEKHFDRRSNPTGCCICWHVFHAKCLPGHQCVSVSFISMM